MEVVISELPLSIQNRIPMSIRGFKDIYDLSDLPSKEQDIIKDYLIKTPDIDYVKVYDIVPTISKTSDLEVISVYKDLILEYLKNYLNILPGEYPFDPSFGCTLKKQLHTKDTELRKTLINTEINNIVDVLSNDMNVSIDVSNISIMSYDKTDHVEYKITIQLKVNNTELSQIGVNVMVT